MPKILGIDRVKPEHDKNYFINGDMRISQRGTSFAAVVDGAFTLDRYRYVKTGAMVHTITQDTDVPTLAQSGYLFQNSLRLNLTTPDTAIAASDRCFFEQHIEGYNWVNLAQKDFTVSFWVKATLTGTYCVAFTNSGTDRTFVSEYTINTTDTWEYKTLKIEASPSGGTWNYSNGSGLIARFILAVGTTFQTTAGAWQTGNFQGTANQVNGVNTGATNFRMTGLMMNEGSVAAPFKLFTEDIGNEQLACFRYYWRAAGANTGSSLWRALSAGQAIAAGNFSTNIMYPVRMRAAATLGFSSAAAIVGSTAAGSDGASNAIVQNSSASAEGMSIGVTRVGGGLVAGDAVQNYINNAEYLDFSAEL